MCEQNYIDTVQLILTTYTLVNVWRKLPRYCAFNTLHAGKYVYKTT